MGRFDGRAFRSDLLRAFILSPDAFRNEDSKFVECIYRPEDEINRRVFRTVRQIEGDYQYLYQELRRPDADDVYIYLNNIQETAKNQNRESTDLPCPIMNYLTTDFLNDLINQIAQNTQTSSSEKVLTGSAAM